MFMMVGGLRMSMFELDNLLVEVGVVKENDMWVLKWRREVEDVEEERIVNKGIKSSFDRRK